MFDSVQFDENVAKNQTLITQQSKQKETLDTLNKYIKTNIQTKKEQTNNPFTTHLVCFSQCIIKLLVKCYQ